MAFVVLVGACSQRETRHDDTIYDRVILNGRVMDSASGLDAPRAVGIVGGTIRAVSVQSVRGRDTLDARGMVVAPGFIDLHQHAQDTAAYRVEALDGTTTALELEGGTADVDRWYDERAGTSLIHYGVSVGHDEVRRHVVGDTGTRTDADLVIFDPTTIIDRATYRQPTLSPHGISYVLVNGVVVVDDGTVLSGRYPGRPIRGPLH